MLELSTFIFLSVILIGFGYVAGNSQNFNIYKLLLLGIVLVPLISVFNLSKAHLLTMSGAFLFGYLLPYANILQFIGDELSNLINAIRYRSAYEDIKRQQDEVEELRRQYEQARQEANRQKQEQARQRHQQESKNYRQNQQNKNSSQSKQKNQSNSGNKSGRSYYFHILDLDSSGNYSYTDIKKAYRKQASKYHPDKHQHKGEKTVKEMNEKFKEIIEAYKTLGITSK